MQGIAAGHEKFAIFEDDLVPASSYDGAAMSLSCDMHAIYTPCIFVCGCCTGNTFICMAFVRIDLTGTHIRVYIYLDPFVRRCNAMMQHLLG